MIIERGNAHTSYAYWTVQVNPGEIVFESGKSLPYGTWIGVIAPTRTTTVWTPACSYKPRGWKPAFAAALEQARCAMNAADWPDRLECEIKR